MPGASPSRDSRQRNTRSMEDEYVVFLQGIPPQCRWQELKDLVRQTALHIRQAVVYDDCHGHPTGLGQIIVKSEDEAWRTYNRLSTNGWNGHSLTVTLSLASSPTKPIAGPTKSPSVNCNLYPPGFPAPLSPPPVSLAPDTPLSPTFSQGSDYGHFYAPTNGVCASHLTSLAPESLHYPLRYTYPSNGSVPAQSGFFPSYDPHALMYPRAPIQAVSSDGHRGSVSTHSSHSTASLDTTAPPPASRHIFIQHLRQDTKSQQVGEYLKLAGATVEKCEVQERKPINGRPRIFATATLRTTEEAKRAIESLDNSVFRGTKIRVRFDRDFNRAGSSAANNTTASKSSSSSTPTSTRSRENTTTRPAPATSTLENGGPDIKKAELETRTTARPKNRDGPSPGKNSGEPLVVNGSCVGLKAGRSNLDVVCHEEELSQKTREIRL